MSSPVLKAKSRIADALNAVDLVEQRLKNVSQSTLAGESILLDACAYRIGVIGEAISYAKTFAPTVFAKNAPRSFSWDEVVALRNHLYHDYNMVTAQAVLMFAKSLAELRLALANAQGAL
ncbi:hypothetical protein RBA41_23240 [Massilia sp. CCM 9210]|uniref:hypothetical protein n=1 Tax=Massilia scottii TaxID=3057166 RepID=UPI002796D3DE|nr:hypothetical protein [Massilia sp. CCM 9210]MDQ1816219.1 hypothetical protein [Massilia sp. CCM 9210]